jgi:hypothetical protein
MEKMKNSKNPKICISNWKSASRPEVETFNPKLDNITFMQIDVDCDAYSNDYCKKH